MSGFRSRFLIAAAATGVALLASGAPPVSAASASPAGPAPEQTLGTLQRTGTVNLSHLSSLSSRAAPTTQGSETVNVEVPKAATGGSAGTVPNPPTTQIVTTSSSLVGTDGISHRDQRLASNGNQQSLEPPDQGLCAGNGHVIEAVNVALQVYSANTLATEVPTTGLNAFFGLPPMINRQTNPVTFGPFLSDPRCYFDTQTRRFYFSILEIDRDPATGALGPGAATLLAVSQSDDPTQGWGLFSVNALDDGSGGTPSHPDCPCFGDQPVIGADANGFYFSTNEYSLTPFGAAFNGAQIYAMSKRRLAAAAVGGTSLPFVHLAAGNLGLTIPPSPDGTAVGIASVQPATTPPGAAYAPNTEYFLSSFDVNVNRSDNRLAVWALTNTSSLDTTPNVNLNAKIVNTEPYAGGPPAGTPVQQKAGPRPLGDALGEPLPTINADDDRMQAPTYVNGLLTSAISTGLGANDQVTKTGIAWFVLAPYLVRGQVSAVIVRQGYVAAPDGTSLMYPFVGLDRRGLGAIALSLTGPDNFPSAGYVAFNLGGPRGPVHIARAGVAPEDGFTCYVAEGFAPPCRWGDYSYATPDDAGHLWIVGEDIPGGPRTTLANWGTFFGRLDPALIQSGG